MADHQRQRAHVLPQGRRCRIYSLLDGLSLDFFSSETFLRVSGDYPLGDYTFSGDIMDIYGGIGTETVSITFVELPDITALELLGSEDMSTWSAVDGDINGGYTYGVDPALAFLYLDAGTYTVNNTLADGNYGFYLDETFVPSDFLAYWDAKGVNASATVGTWYEWMWQIINGNQPMFYLKVAGSEYSLLDGLSLDFFSSETFLRVSGDYPLGDYTFSGDIVDIYGGIGTETVSVTFELTEAAALDYVIAETTLTGTLAELTATFPDSIPPVIVDEPYKINSRMTLADALPAGTTVTIKVLIGGVPYDYVTNVLVPGTEFWITDLIPGSVAADFDANYGGKIEVYSITIENGGEPALPIDTTVLIESIISKDDFVTEVVLADITLHIQVDADEDAALQWVMDNTTLTGTLAELTATFPDSIPPVIVAEPYKINSKMTLADALPAGTTVTIKVLHWRCSIRLRNQCIGSRY